MDAELREWLGIAPADFSVYFSIICLIAAFFVSAGALDTTLVTAALLASIASCIVGMRKDVRFSEITNAAKLVTYPAFFIMCLVVTFVNFKFWN